DERQLVLDANLGPVVVHEVLVQEDEGDDLHDAAGDNGEHDPDDRLPEGLLHALEDVEVRTGPLEGRGELSLQTSSTRLLPSKSQGGVEEVDPALVVIAH